MKILVTGAAGFIGYHLIQSLLYRGDDVVGLDILNDYYDVNLKYARLEKAGILKNTIQYNKLIQSSSNPHYSFVKMKLEDLHSLKELFINEQFNVVCNLAAQAGVRYSLTNPHAYTESNISGFLNILECCRQIPLKHLVYASSSSVYGLNQKMPFSTHHNVDHPVSLYAATKKANELMAHTYSYLYNIPTSGLRFFTVYGPWGRPDMALFIFTKNILENKPIKIFNNGQMKRDFTYIDDIIDGVVRVIDYPPKGDALWDGLEPDPPSSICPYQVYNIGNNKPVDLMDFIAAIEEKLGKKAIKEFLPMQPGDVPQTWADTSALKKELGYIPKTRINAGVSLFVDWYKEYYSII